MDDLSNRHEGTIDGRLAPIDATGAATVSIAIPRRAASAPSCQHTAWMLVNLLCRQQRIVDRILLSCPPDVPLQGRVVPLAPRTSDLRSALMAGAAAIDGVPATVEESTDHCVHLIVGPGPGVRGAIRVHGERWWGGISIGSIESDDAGSPNPLGPYVAACLASSEVFKATRLVDPTRHRLTSVFYSTWSDRVFPVRPLAPENTGPAAYDDMRLDVLLAGCGAVGTAWLHTIWASPAVGGRAVLSDADSLGVDLSNLNRCPVFGRASIGQPKASEAARICADGRVALVPHADGAETVVDRPSFVISAVDSNASRSAVQALYPARLISASTHNLRAEVLRCDPTCGAPCIRCFNPPEEAPPDVELRRQFLAAPEAERRESAERVGMTLEAAEQWAIRGTCSYASDRLLAQLRHTDQGVAAFAVGFVSVMAGTMLAAQTIKEALGVAPLGGITSRAVFQFFDPLSKRNASSHFLRDPSCPMCDSSTIAANVWRRRYEEYSVGGSPPAA